jgi:putative ABC transport system ATP-binding protein
VRDRLAQALEPLVVLIVLDDVWQLADAEPFVALLGPRGRQRTVSGGQQQRVSIARAIAHNPRVLFADEPTANLDSENSRLVMKAFLDLHASGQTIVMVTHEDEYARMAKRIVKLKDGVIVEDKR